MRKEHATEFSAALAVVIGILSIPLFLFIDYSKVSIEPLVIMFFVMIFAAIAFILVAKGLRHMEISSTSPLLALTPMLTAVWAWLFLKESLSFVQMSGIFLALVGVYILETKRGHSLLEPFRIIKRSKYIHFLLIAIFLYSVTSTFDRFILSRYEIEPLAYLAFAHLFLAFHFLVIHSLFHDGIKGIYTGFKKYGGLISLVALFAIGYRFTGLTAIDMAYVGLVLPIKRSSVLLTTFVGGELFHEHDLGRKMIAALIIVLGVIIIIL